MNKLDEIIKYTSSLKLLFVEDDKQAREAAKFLFDDFFDNIILAVDGVDGLDKFINNDIDLIITDINMPNLDGLGMIEGIRKIDTEVPILILSSHMKSEYFIQSIKLNVKGYLLKPIDMDNLLEIFESIISSIKLKAEILKNEKIKEQNYNYIQSIIDGISDPIMVIAKDYTVKTMNSSLKQNLKNLNIADINNPKCYEVSHHRSTPCDGTEHPCPLTEVMDTKKKVTVVHEHYDCNGEKKQFIELVATPQFDEDNNFIGIIESARDITSHIEAKEELKQQKEMLQYVAHHDNLTGLVNRVLFNDRLTQSILRAKRNNTKMGLFFIDFNRFKQINDMLGHKMGDDVLKIVSELMKKCMRESDEIARFGGDEFVVLVENIVNAKDTLEIANKLLKTIELPIELNSHLLNISASIGIAIYPDDTTQADTLVKYADAAMYKAKKDTNKKILYYNDGKMDEY